MSRSQNLRHNVINQVIEDMARGNIPSPLPSQSGLAEMYNISRTTVRHILQHLSACGVLTSGKGLCCRPQTRTERWFRLHHSLADRAKLHF